MRKALFILGQLSDLDIEWMIQKGKRMVVRPRQVLIQQDQAIENLYIVLEGEFSITNRQLASKEIARIGNGEIVGEMSFIDARPPSATVTAATHATVFALPRKAINNKIKNDPSFAARFYLALSVFLSDRLRKTTATLGYGSEDDESLDELDFNVMDNIHLAGSRFDRILKKLSDS